jgi:hypothetical protein
MYLTKDRDWNQPHVVVVAAVWVASVNDAATFVADSPKDDSGPEVSIEGDDMDDVMLFNGLFASLGSNNIVLC